MLPSSNVAGGAEPEEVPPAPCRVLFASQRRKVYNQTEEEQDYIAQFLALVRRDLALAFEGGEVILRGAAGVHLDQWDFRY